VEDEAHKRARNVAYARAHAERFVPVVSPEAGASSAQPAAAAPLPACLANTASDCLQVIMQMLDSRSSLRLARCSRSLLRFALSRPAAWENDMLQLRINGGRLRVSGAPPSALSPLLRLVPVRLCINGSPSRPGALLTDARVTQLFMHAYDRIRDAGPIVHFLKPLFLPASCRAVDGRSEDHPSAVAAARRGVQLRSLRIRLFSDAVPDSLEPLVALPNLKHVGLWAFGMDLSYAPLLAPLLRCPRLSCLALVRTELALGKWRAFLVQVGHSRTALKTFISEDLCQPVTGDPLPVAEFVGAFGTLTRCARSESVALGLVPELNQLAQQHALRQLSLFAQRKYEMTSLMVHGLFHQLPAPLCLHITDPRKLEVLQQLAREEPRFTAGIKLPHTAVMVTRTSDWDAHLWGLVLRFGRMLLCFARAHPGRSLPRSQQRNARTIRECGEGMRARTTLCCATSG